MTEFNQDKFESKAKKLVVKYLNYEVNEKEVSIVWFKKGEVYAEAMLKDLDDLDDHRFVVSYFYEEGVYSLDIYCLEGWVDFHEEEL
ncbi:hypothetical protein [Limosilactobacillus fermentum]|uniref:hypothetical protein n=1 Tax=Limosilactobacillus fermentum TaxID=1613 RepID=UPI003DA56A0B